MGILMELQPKQQSNDKSKQQDSEPTEHEANDLGPSRMMSSYGCAENRLPDHHWPPQAFRAGLPIPPSGPIFGPPGIYPPPGGDRPPPPHRMSPPASWLTPPHFMSPVATSSLSPHATSSSTICKSGNRDDPAGLHHQDNKMTDPRDLMTSRLCSSPSALPPPTTLLELPVDHQGPPLCAGCRLRIVDKFYLCAVEAKWHAACLKCSDCGVELANQLSCFERDGNIYCKEDYIRIYANNRTCARCLLEIQSSDLVMKARHCLFHVDCFRCATCDTLLKKGDLFGMYDDVLYCRLHFELITASPHHNSSGGHCPPPPGTFPRTDPLGHSPIGDHYPPLGPLHPGMGYSFMPPGAGGGPGEPPWFPGSPCPGDFAMSDVPYDNNNEPFLKKRRGRKKRKVESFAAMNGYLDSGYPPGMEGHSGQGKSKRARTSFKHHQLRIMKAHFQINQNPDSRELKMLSQKTGLDKKVLQVWFQNARAKWRRMNAQSGGNPPMGGSGATGGGNTDTSSSENGLSSIQDDPCDTDTMGLGP